MNAPAAEQEFEELLLSVGRLNYAWTNTESLLIHLIAGLCAIDKETAVVVFLTLNTTRARIDLVERLAKLDRRDPAERDAVLALTRRVGRGAALRNHYNHCIYSFDPESGHPRTILMRIADRRDNIRMGLTTDIDAAAMADIDAAIADLREVNAEIWRHIKRYGYPA